MRLLISLCALVCGAASVRAADIHISPDGTVNELHPDGVYRPVPGAAKQKPPAIAASPAVSSTSSAHAGDGLDEVNAKRAARSLRPFVRDEGLTRAAEACAAFRAEHRLFGHTQNDFAFVPQGTRADSAGCAAYPASYGWLSCCTYEGYTYAGAAFVTGGDGKRYMHLFVSHGGSGASAAAPVAAPQAFTVPAYSFGTTCANGQCQQPTTVRRRR